MAMIDVYQITDNETGAKAGRGLHVDKITVLIVDDTAAVRDGLRSILQAYPDMDVVGEATNGEEAIDQAEQLQPAVILMDVQMPGTDGIAATRHIKKQSPDVRVLVLTVHTKYIDDALAAGADAYLRKDSGRQEPVQAIRDLSHR